MSAPPVVNPQNAIADAAPARGQDRHLLMPPAAQYVRVDDKLIVDFVNTVANATIIISYRLMNTSGEIVEFQNIISPAVSTAIQTVAVPLNEGFLLGATVGCGNVTQVRRGQMFVVASIGRLIGPSSFLRGMCIISDYATSLGQLAWPGGQIRQATDGAGFVTSLPVGVPAAGADWLFNTFGVNTRTRIRAVYATLTASAAVANRTVELRLTTGQGTLRITTTVAQTASQALAYLWSPCFNSHAVNGSSSVAPLESDLVILGNQTLQTVTNGIQAADQWGSIGIIAEQWIDT